jgi:trimethylamine--corrinoid protein Co-methyltransferase
MRGGAKDAAARAGDVWRKRLAEYEQPALEEPIRAELEEYVTRRRAELGD